MVDRRDACRRAIGHEAVAPVPFSIKFTAEAKARYRDFLGRDFDPVLDTGSYVVASHTNDGWHEVKPGYWRDFFGVVWNRTADKTLGVVDEPLLAGPSFGAYAFPDADGIPVYDRIRDNRARYADRFHMVSIGFTLFERAWSLCGMVELMTWMIEEPTFVHELLERITDYNVRVIENAAALGVDAVHFGDDWGSQQGLLIGPDMWREFIGPRFARACAAARERGLLVSLHSCGNVRALLPDMIAAGVDVFDPFQPEAMDIWAVYEEYRGRLAFWGGLSVQQTFPYGTPADVRHEAERLLEGMGRRGGYILAPAHSLTGDVPPENIQAFLDAARGQ